MDELKPIVSEFLSQPIAFLGGFVSGALRLDLHQDPLKAWLAKQGATPQEPAPASNNGNRPQSISIDD
ncbi:MAG: hypothetical protein ACK456_10260 [Pseudanabaenaceae cyanobacterium]|jgi:hypothetical protein